MDALAKRVGETSALLIGALLILLLTATAGLTLWRAREDTLATWRVNLSTFSATAAEHAAQSIRSADFVLGRVIDRINSYEPENDAQLRAVGSTRELYEFLRERASELQLIDVLTIVATDGTNLNFSRGYPVPPMNLADRDYFKAHLADPGLEFYLSAPVPNRANGHWTFYLARKIKAPSGRTIGIALAGIEVNYFESFYHSINFHEAGTTISLFRRDGILLARHPERPDALGKSFSNAAAFRALNEALAQGKRATTAMTRAPRVTDGSDSSPRMVAPQVVESLPLVTAVLATEDLMLRNWRQTAWIIGGGTLAVDGVIALVALLVHRLLKRRRAALQELEAARAAAETASRVKSRFLANMSHEIRTPLHGMLGMTQLLLASSLTPSQQQQVQLIARSGRLLQGVIDDVLDFSRIEAGRLELERMPVDLAQLAQDCIALFRQQAQIKGLAVRLDMPIGRPCWVIGDSLRLCQIINNLLSNAIKFTATGSVTLSVAPQGGNRWRLAVRDTGIGLTEEQRKRVFQPFTQADNSTTRRFGGSGLGLSIVSRLVQLYGGELGVESTPGAGAEFWCVLELLPATPPAAAAGDAAAAASTDTARRILRVLVAEDNDVNMLLACAMLQQQGAQVLQAADGAAAVAQWESEHPDLILMDLHMPELDGLQATVRIRALEAQRRLPRTPIVALTADVLPEDRQRCLDAGMDDVLLKPFRLDQLATLLARIGRGERVPTPSS